MKIQNLAAALMAIGLLMTAPAFAQSAGANKQRTQEGGGFAPLPCALPYNADPADDPDCQQQLKDSSRAAAAQAARQSSGQTSGQTR
jgi:hypothetical protein